MDMGVGDGFTEWSSEAQISYRYLPKGTHTVTLEIMDRYGEITSSSLDVVIE